MGRRYLNNGFYQPQRILDGDTFFVAISRWTASTKNFQRQKVILTVVLVYGRITAGHPCGYTRPSCIGWGHGRRLGNVNPPATVRLIALAACRRAMLPCRARSPGSSSSSQPTVLIDMT
ncbi:hypothetical protein [Micromonospora qiuiae]|uniref:hypothetical protein n=1 Tax=Micromonospora qiuiae TaxID=502268 RepID=UPI00194EDDF1|nr:hypothetical protein [Micromonospora qiuiae]